MDMSFIKKRIVVKHNQLLKKSLIFLLFAYIIYIRFSWFDQHFTHYDDIKVAQLTNYDIDVFTEKFEQLKYKGGFCEEIYNLCYLLFHGIYNWCDQAINFSRYWTYAPAQFVLTFSLLPLAKDYNGVKFFGRFPSLLCGIIAVFVCWNVINKITNSKKVSIIGTCILGFSWQSILYCMHMSNYESIIMCGFLAAMILIRCIETNTDNTKNWLIGAFIIGAMTWMHYQVLCLMGGYIVTYIVYCWFRKYGIKKIIINCILIGFSYASVVIPLLTFANMQSVPSWNVGINKQYLFQFKFDIIYIIRFFLQNFYIVFKAMLSPVSLESPLSNILACFNISVFMFGIVRGIRDYKRKSLAFWITIFNIGVLLTEICFVIMGKFTLSPTRHSNVLIPIFVMEISIALYFIFSYIKNSLYNFLPYLIVCVLLIIFANGYGDVKKQRLDVFSNEKISNIVTQYSPDLIIERHGPQIWYILDNVYARRDIIDYQTDFYDRDNYFDNNKTIMFISYAYPVDIQLLDEVTDSLIEHQYLDMEQINLLKEESRCIYSFEQTSNVDFDFFNVGYGGANNLYYSIYAIK